MSPCRKWFTHFTPLPSPINVVLGDDSSILATGVSHIPVHMHANNEWQPAILQDDLYIPTLHRNLLLLTQLACHGAEMCFMGKGCQILNQ
jgi:hypothetical protein